MSRDIDAADIRLAGGMLRNDFATIAHAAADAEIARIDAAAASGVADVDDAVAAQFYVDTTAGLAATAEGGFFKTRVNGRVVTWREVAGAAVEWVVSISSADADDLRRDISPFVKSVIGTGAERIVDMQLVGPDNVALYAGGYYVKYIARTASNTLYLNICQPITEDVITSVGINGTASDPTGLTGVQRVELVDCFSLGITGYAWIDFKDGSNFGSLVAFAAADTLLDNDKVVLATPLMLDTIADVAGAESEKVAASQFLPGVSTMLRDLFTGVYVYNGIPGHVYGISLIETGTYRVRIQVNDFTIGVVACSFVEGDGVTTLIDYETLEASFNTIPGVLDGFGVEQDSGIWAHFDADWSKAVVPSTTTFTTAAQAGFKPDRHFTTEQIEALAFDEHYHEEIPVAVGELRTKMVALWNEGEYASPDTTLAVRNCRRAHPNHHIALKLAGGLHSALNLYRPNWVSIVGVDQRGSTRIIHSANAASPILQSHGSGDIADLHLEPDESFAHASTEYLWHIDQNGRDSQAPTAYFAGAFGAVNRDRTFQNNRNVTWECADGQTAFPLAGGMPSGAVIRFTNCGAKNPDHDSNANAMFFHNGPGATREAWLEVERFDCPDRMAGIVVTTAHTGAAAGVGCTLKLNDVNVHAIAVDVTQGVGNALSPLPNEAASRSRWRIAGKSNAAISVSGGAQGSRVLATTPGVTVSGTGATVGFGIVDERGRGSLLIMEESDGSPSSGGDKSLGARFGDCTALNKSITVGAQTKTLNLDYTGMTEAAILASINSTLTTNPITVVDIAPEMIVSNEDVYLGLNGSGATMLRGVLLAWTDAKTVEPAAAGAARVDAVGLRLHVNGALSEVFTGPLIGSDMIPEVGATTGEFGVGAGGRLSFAQAVKVGRVIAGRVEFYR